MSGIAGIVNLDGAPIDRVLLSRMTKFMSFRGANAQEVRTEENAGFSHAAGGDVWITADARIDGGENGDLTDDERILRAYERWGEGCVEHLIGDFAFVIWDKRLRRLFCARDHFGVKPFFYTRIGNTFIFSNT